MRKHSVSIRELQQNLRKVMAWVERGQVIEVTRRRRPVARLAPLGPVGVIAPWPDLDERARAVFGSRAVAPGAGEQVIADRGAR
jgi:prevent-host-death family protein